MIEFELYNYDNTKEEIEAMKDEIIGRPPLPAVEQDNIQRTTVSDPTYSKVVTMTTNVTLSYMERTIKAIDRALQRLDETHNEIFEQRYRQGKNWRESLSELYISQDTYFKKRREIILAVAVQLGLALPFHKIKSK
jgi:RinA family phage transcriptional activator